MRPKKWWEILQGYARGTGQLATLPKRSTRRGLGLEKKHWTSTSDSIYSREAV